MPDCFPNVTVHSSLVRSLDLRERSLSRCHVISLRGTEKQDDMMKLLHEYQAARSSHAKTEGQPRTGKTIVA